MEGCLVPLCDLPKRERSWTDALQASRFSCAGVAQLMILFVFAPCPPARECRGGKIITINPNTCVLEAHANDIDQKTNSPPHATSEQQRSGHVCIANMSAHVICENNGGASRLMKNLNLTESPLTVRGRALHEGRVLCKLLQGCAHSAEIFMPAHKPTLYCCKSTM